MTRRVRDFTDKQFRDAIEKSGWTFTGFMGYVNLGDGLSACRFNAGDNKRAQLAWLQRQADRHQQEREEASK